MNETVRNAVCYARFSSDNQREESIDAQLRAMHEYAAHHNMNVVGTFIDRAKSATTDNRPEFLRMVRAAQEGQFDTVLVHKLDRFARNRYDSAHYKHLLRKNGVVLRSVVEPLDDTPESIIMESVLEGMAEYYSRNLARETMKGLMENARQGKHTGGLPPLGYNVDRQTKKLVVNEQEAETVRLIFRMVLEGESYSTIIDELRRRGHKTKIGSDFGSNSLHSILQNEKYTGMFVFSKRAARQPNGRYNAHACKDDADIIRLKDAFPALISEEDFLAVKQLMAGRRLSGVRQQGQARYLLSGMIACGICGCNYSGIDRKPSKRSPNRTISYYCLKRNTEIPCQNREIRRDAVETHVFSMLAPYLFQSGMLPDILAGYNAYRTANDDRTREEIDAVKKHIARLDREIGHVAAAIAQTGSPALTQSLTQLETQRAERMARYQDLTCQAESELISEDDIRRSFTYARLLFLRGKLPLQHKIISLLVERVVMFPDHMEIELRVRPKADRAAPGLHMRNPHSARDRRGHYAEGLVGRGDRI